MNRTWKFVVGGSVAAVAVVAITFSLALLPDPIFAAASPYGMHAGPLGYGFRPWHAMSYSGNGTGNWTGSVSINSIKAQTIDTIKNKVKVSVGDAASAAEKSLGTGSRIGSVSLAPVNGYLVYAVLGIDGSDNIHRLFVDVGNGNVLADQKVNLP